jgi:uncharacterized protein YecE (DUF72 family)
MLPFYADRFNSVELNNTFYRNPQDAAVRSWAQAVPSRFRFAVKANRWIMFARDEAAVAEAMGRFAALMEGFRSGLGAVLFHFPGNALYAEGRVEAIVRQAPRGWRLAFEFSHPSWFERQPLSAVRDPRVVLSEVDGEPGPKAEDWTARDFSYLRLRRDRYPPRRLDGWAERAGERLAGGQDVYLYFKHGEQAPTAALQLTDRLHVSIKAGI